MCMDTRIGTCRGEFIGGGVQVGGGGLFCCRLGCIWHGSGHTGTGRDEFIGGGVQVGGGGLFCCRLGCMWHVGGHTFGEVVIGKGHIGDGDGGDGKGRSIGGNGHRVGVVSALAITSNKLAIVSVGGSIGGTHESLEIMEVEKDSSHRGDDMGVVLGVVPGVENGVLR
jgi:hypothetical protein